MNNKNLSPLEIYINRVFKIIMVAIPSIAISAGATFSVLKLLGFYKNVSFSLILLFDLTCVIYLLIGLYFSKNCEDSNGILKSDVIKKGKLFFYILYLIQWNFITYMIPSRDFWAYAVFFILLSLVFLDGKFILYISIEIFISIIVSWIIIPDRLLPIRDENFIPEIVLRVVFLLLGFGTVWQLSYMIRKKLANELEKIADYDTLTLLYNRRKLETYLESAIKQKNASGTPFSVVMIDLDDFKSVNDTYGHSCGDAVLKDIANIIRNTVGNDGLVFRYGGEEILVLIYIDIDEAYRTSEAIRKSVESHKTHFEDITVNVTVTIGVATCSKSDTAESLIKRADSNLYYGKTHGKNCVIR